MEVKDFKARLASGRLAGCYLFTGEEDYLVKYYLSELTRSAGGDPSLAVFNKAVYDGAEVDFAALTDAVKSPPMFEDYKVIVWHNASFARMKEGDLAALEDLLDLISECDYVILAFTSPDGEVDLGTAKRASKFAKRFEGKMEFLSFDRSTDAQLLSWLKKHFDAEGVAVSADTLRSLIFRSGHSMSVLLSEVKKLSAYAKQNSLSEITSKQVDEVASSTPESDTFALSNAVMDKNKRAALAALDEMKLRRADPIMIIGMLAKTLSELSTVTRMVSEGLGKADIASLTGLNPYRVGLYMNAARKYTPDAAAAILSELSRVDTSSKFGGVTGYAAIELFICKCL